MTPAKALVVGIDYGTLSGRAVVVRVADGVELGSAVYDYPHAVVDTVLPTTGKALPPDWALQVPQDYLNVLTHAVPQALAAAGADPADVIGIGVDFTACTMVPVTADGTPLCDLPEYADRPHAYAKLWKHHAAQGQADRITELARERGEKWLPRFGGMISSEWEFAKGLQLLEEDPELYAATAHWVECADWLIWQLTGVHTRNVCTAGYKGLRQDGQYPSAEYCAALNPDFADFVADKLLGGALVELGEKAGELTEQASAWTGLPTGIAVAAGVADAHATNPAANAIQPGQMVAIMGTSTCHIMNDTEVAEVPGMCGVVYGGVTKGLWGYEAGQSGVGDIFGHFVKTSVPPSYYDAAQAKGLGIHEYLTELATTQMPGEHGLLALDWHSGNRSVLVDHELSGLIVGLTLYTKPEDVYRALIEATAFGAKTIVETFVNSGVSVNEFVVAGGLAKNAMLMQIYADITRLPLSVSTSSQACALGAAIHGAVAAGAYRSLADAAAAMGSKESHVYNPIPDNAAVYDELFAEYTRLHDYFGRGDNDVMHHLKALRRKAIAAK